MKTFEHPFKKAKLADDVADEATGYVKCDPDITIQKMISNINNMPAPNNIPINKSLIDEVTKDFQIQDISKATIREVKAIAAKVEQISGVEFIKMEMGVPGLPPSPVGVKAQIEALKKGVASIYTDIDGYSELKKQASRFVKAFINVDVNPEGCIPVAGSMQGTFVSFLTCCQCYDGKDTVLFIDPGFPVQKQQLKVMGLKYETFDVYKYRGKGLKDKLESYFNKGNISAIIYSNPNNPTWMCLKEEELKTIGDLATQYDIVVLEDLAYFGMDFRRNIGTPFQAPYQPSVANYTKNYILLISGSKAFSYAGERIGVCCISNDIYPRNFPGLTERYDGSSFGVTFVHRILYSVSSGTGHSVQYAMAAILKSACDGNYNFVDNIKVYGERAKRLKEIFLRHGFNIVYDKDLDEPVANGFYFTIGYPDMTGNELAKELMYYGVSAISLQSTGSEKEGLRACTSFIKNNQYDLLDERMKIFEENHPNK